MLVIDALDSTGSSQPLLHRPQLLPLVLWILKKAKMKEEEQLLLEEQVVPSVAGHARNHRHLLLSRGSPAGPPVDVPLVVLLKRRLIQQLATTPMMKRMMTRWAAREETMMKRAAKEVMMMKRVAKESWAETTTETLSRATQNRMRTMTTMTGPSIQSHISLLGTVRSILQDGTYLTT
jgi:hypothetical protein